MMPFTAFEHAYALARELCIEHGVATTTANMRVLAEQIGRHSADFDGDQSAAARDIEHEQGPTLDHYVERLRVADYINRGIFA